MADDWARLTRASVAGVADALVFHRSGTAKTVEAAGTFWAGDQEQSWGVNDGLASLPRTLVSSGLFGWLVHSDVGGMVYGAKFLCARTDELLGRWLELSGLTDPWLRTHPSNGYGKVPQVWSSPENAARAARAEKLHSALAAYKRGLIDAATVGAGAPLVRHTYFNCAAAALDGAAYDALGAAQLLVGDDVLVAPVVSKGAVAVDALVPPVCSRGARVDKSPNWRSIWAPEEALRPLAKIALAAPLGSPAVLVRNGTAAAAALIAAAAEMGRA